MIVGIENLTCGYTNKILIKDLSFEVATGEAVCILGANGIGKTTLFKSILGQQKAISGDIKVDGKSISDLTLKEKAKLLSYVPQAKAYAYRYSVLDIVMMGRAPYIGTFEIPSESDYKIVYDTLEKLSMTQLGNRYYDELSGGEQQIVLIARAIAQKAKFVLLDEPASNLDFYNQNKLISIVNMLKREDIGIFMVSHNPEHAFLCCEKALLIGGKGQYFYGSVKDIITESNLKTVYGTDIGIKCFSDGRNQDRYVFFVK